MLMQMTTTVLAIHAWTMPSVVHLMEDLRAVRVRSTWQVPAASSVRGIVYCRHIVSEPHVVLFHRPTCRNNLREYKVLYVLQNLRNVSQFLAALSSID